MNYVWLDYDPGTMGFVEKWLDAEAVKSTGLDEGFRDFYDYWANEEGFLVGGNFWCKVVCERDEPVAVIAFCLHEGRITIMEILVKPEKRGQGLGTAILKELLENGDIQKSEAVIFPGNTASQKAFENAGYRCHRIYEDGSAKIYVYEG